MARDAAQDEMSLWIHMLHFLQSTRHWAGRIIWLVLLLLVLNRSTGVFVEPDQVVRRYTRQIEFDFVDWTLDALGLKVGNFSLGGARYLSEADRNELVLELFHLIEQTGRMQADLLRATSDPQDADPELAAEIRVELALLEAHKAEIQPLAEAVLQEQTADVLEDMGLGFAGGILPPVAFHITPLPDALIVSAREVIRQDANIQLTTGLDLSDHIALEQTVESQLGVSSLVVSVGGIGTYPTMVMETSAFSWVVEVVVHEWIHNYLTLRPLGINYNTNPELRTMNESVANLLGKEIGRQVLEKYYPAFAPPPPAPRDEVPLQPQGPPEPPVFDFRAEMHTTRLRADELLAQGEIERAEAYMEARRQVFWDNGYRIRRLNQAYFAFHGAYADQPGGAAGEDPVGAAVRALWDRFQDPVAFLRTVSWMDDFGDLQSYLAQAATNP